MKHVEDQLPAFLAGELSAADQADIRRHLAECPACAGASVQLRQLWELLGEAAMPADLAPASTWPAIRSRTFGGARAPRIGSGRWGRTGIAAVALAAGLGLAILLPAGKGSVSDHDLTSTAAWGSGFWLDDATTDTFSDLWLAAADEGDGS